METKNIYNLLKERILILDGAMGTMIQRYNLNEEDFRGTRFTALTNELKGCNDILAITRPDVLEQIHREYLTAGADIITTCSFNAHPISLADYGLSELSEEISQAAAAIGRRLADEFNNLNPSKPRFVAGSMGPTNRTASISADVMNPAAREVDFDTLLQGYIIQLKGMLKGGVDLVLVETIFDSLNAKAALLAVDMVGRELGREIPVMASGTLADASGRTLAGQSVEAFYNSLSHARLVSIGLNCAFGASDLQPYLERLSIIAKCAISAHPNAGLPNVMGGYDETPEMFAKDVEQYLHRGLVNIIGGCCGTTPQHILLLNELAKKYSPRKANEEPANTTLSGLDLLTIRPEQNFINIGERCNVAGSLKFARLIREGNFDEALSIARSQVDAGAQIIDVCMDDGMIDAETAMTHFLALIASEPEIARLPLMIDSSKWEVLKSGLKMAQGKSVVNSISIKEGEEEFIHRAMEIHNMGAAAVVMLFDEKGQADTYERKIEIAERAYKLLTQNGFPAEDIIFDANVLAVATGIEEHDSYAKAFIDATRWIKQNLPLAKVSGGVSNLSFAFRGNNRVREAMHSVFLFHAIEAGMDMAIVNAQMLQVYDEIEPELLERIEDVILMRRADAAERLIDFAEALKGEPTNTAIAADGTPEWRKEDLTKRIEYAMVKGFADYIEEDTAEGYAALQSPLRVIDELLMPAMEYVGKLFGEGKMFLPQVVKTARVMKRAVGVLTPHIEALRESGEQQSRHGARVVLATVKGDVHDIGKNIVAVVMSCNGHEVNDLGVMVDTNKIVDTAIEISADAITMSGLITPSLEEMIRVAKECEARNISIPIIIGGATTSPLHTAVKIAPNYSGVIIHAHNASDNPKILSQLMSEDREEYIAAIKQEQASLRADYEKALNERNMLSLEEARKSGAASAQKSAIKALHTGRVAFHDVDIETVAPYIDWNFFFSSWGLKGRYPEILKSEKYGEQASKLYEEAQAMLANISQEKSLTLQGVASILPAKRSGDDIIVSDKKGVEHRLPMLRQQIAPCRSTADFIAESDDHICLFALSAGFGLEEISEKFRNEGDDYSAMMAKFLADRLTEAFAEHIHRFVRRDMWGYEEGEELSTKDIIAGKYKGVRIAFGYPATPDHSLKRDVFKLLNVEMMTQMKLDAESYMINPAESLCGIILHEGEYYDEGKITEEQVQDYAKRRNMTQEEVQRLIPNNL